MYIKYNANPKKKRADDCTVRAISEVLGKSWDSVYCELCDYGRYFCDMPSSNYVWGQYLIDHGYKRQGVESMRCTVKDFAREHKRGRYILALHGHVLACINGSYIDTWDSGENIVIYYWEKE